MKWRYLYEDTSDRVLNYDNRKTEVAMIRKAIDRLQKRLNELEKQNEIKRNT